MDRIGTGEPPSVRLHDHALVEFELRTFKRSADASVTAQIDQRHRPRRLAQPKQAHVALAERTVAIEEDSH